MADLYLLSGLVMVVLFVLVLVHVINEVYYVLLESESYDGFEFLSEDPADLGYRRFPLKRYPVGGRARKLYPNLIGSNGRLTIGDVDPDLFDIMMGNIVHVYAEGGKFLRKEDMGKDVWRKMNLLIGRYPERGKFIPRIQSPTDICKICSTFLLDGETTSPDPVSTRESRIRGCMVILYSALLYADRHQERDAENTLVGCSNYISPPGIPSCCACPPPVTDGCIPIMDL